MFNRRSSLTATITISNPNITSYFGIFGNKAGSGGKITVNYTSVTSSLVGAMIAGKHIDANVV